jgi:2-oxoglutarate/2-oxoacid ferredoxin oxidoreductase subunit beta
VKALFSSPKCIKDKRTHYCAGCGHGIIHRIIGEVIDELGIRDKTIGIAPVGCAVIAYEYFDMDFAEAPHGRTPAVATGIKRCLPGNVVFTYQGDGDLAAIGTGEIVHAANRGENITVIFVNNATYGMTGGQMAPTTIEGQITTTTPMGRDRKIAGYPIKITEMLAVLPGVVYLERAAVNSVSNIRKAKKAVLKAFKVQLAGKGFSMIEILAACPSSWKKTPLEANEWIAKEMMKVFHLGVIKDEA